MENLETSNSIFKNHRNQVNRLKSRDQIIIYKLHDIIYKNLNKKKSFIIYYFPSSFTYLLSPSNNNSILTNIFRLVEEPNFHP